MLEFAAKPSVSEGWECPNRQDCFYLADGRMENQQSVGLSGIIWKPHDSVIAAKNKQRAIKSERKQK